MRRLVLLLVMFLVPTATTGASAAATAAPASAKTVKLAPGVTWTRMNDPAGPWKINIITIRPSRRVGLDVASAGPSLPATAKVSRMGMRAGALLALNGDFGAAIGAPVHAVVHDGELVQMGSQVGNLFAWTASGKLVSLGRPDVTVTIDDVGRHKPRRVASWNGEPPTLDRMVAYTDTAGSLLSPPLGACSVRYVATGAAVWTTGKLAVERPYEVDAVECGGAPMAPSGGVVLSVLPTSPRAAWMRSLQSGERATISRSVGWPGIVEAIGGMPMLLQAGQPVYPATCVPAEFCLRNPRTAVGVNDACIAGLKGCLIFLVTVDGRGPSVGMTFPEEAALLTRLGATWGMNLDGGGSTDLWIRGRGVVNRPSDGSERPVPNALVVIAS